MPFNLSITPPELELLIPPDKTITQAYNITNNSDSAITLKATIEPWQADGTTGAVRYLTANEVNHVLDFSTFNADIQLGVPFVIPANQKRQIVLKIKSLPNTVGDSYQTLFLTQVDDYNLNSSGTGAIGRIGSHILVSISPTQNINYQAQINQFHTTPTIKDIFFSTITLDGLVENKSKFYFKTDGQITITKGGQVFKQLTLTPLNVAADQSRQILCQTDKNITPCTLTPPFWPGIYNATLTLNPALHAAPTTITFFVFPYLLMLFIGALFVLGFMVGKIKSKSHPRT